MKSSMSCFERLLILVLLWGALPARTFAEKKEHNNFIVMAGFQGHMISPVPLFTRDSAYTIDGEFNLHRTLMFTANAFGEHTVGLGLSFLGLNIKEDIRNWLFYYANDNWYLRLERGGIGATVGGPSYQQRTYGNFFRAQLIRMKKGFFSHGPMYMAYEAPTRYAYFLEEQIESSSNSYDYYGYATGSFTEYDHYTLHAIDPRANYRVYGYAPMYVDIMLLALRNGSLPRNFGIRLSDSFGLYIDGRVIVGIATVTPSLAFADDVTDADMSGEVNLGSAFITFISELQAFMLLKPTPRSLVKLGVWDNNFSSFYSDEVDSLTLHWGPMLEVGGRF